MQYSERVTAFMWQSISLDVNNTTDVTVLCILSLYFKGFSCFKKNRICKGLPILPVTLPLCSENCIQQVLFTKFATNLAFAWSKDMCTYCNLYAFQVFTQEEYNLSCVIPADPLSCFWKARNRCGDSMRSASCGDIGLRQSAQQLINIWPSTRWGLRDEAPNLSGPWFALSLGRMSPFSAKHKQTEGLSVCVAVTGCVRRVWVVGAKCIYYHSSALHVASSSCETWRKWKCTQSSKGAFTYMYLSLVP